MTLKLSEFKALNKPSHYSFNVWLDLNGWQLILVGFRLTNGYISPPAMFSGGKYYGALYLDGEIAKAIYDEIKGKYEVKDFEKATKGLIITEERASIYLPKVFKNAD